MTLLIPLWLILCSLPWLLCFFLSLGCDATKSGSWFSTSDRDAFWFMAAPLSIIASLIIALVYWIGRANGWWAIAGAVVSGVK